MTNKKLKLKRKTKIMKIAIIGIEGTARNIIEQIDDAVKNHGYQAEIAGVVIDTYPSGSLMAGFPVLCGTWNIDTLLNDTGISFIFALYKPDKLKERYNILMSYRIPYERFTNFVHPMAYVARSVRMGNGNVILSNSTIQSNVIIGDFNIINSGVTIEHESVLGNGNFIAANSCLGSKVKIGSHCFIGLNSSVRENVTLGDELFVGMHSLVLKDYGNEIITGIPAKPIS
ncbi:MAG TPA: sialic acid O-acetyltransferase [Bacteroidales bacterium]|nr:sialic acid O-acetyltransferase [Bacteroidales bacterium]